ncbi:hypothetical protein [Acaryochloris marina]|nr:hypothetical protein [Acaryochloris marina]BDM79647.1 hypothetical protein AM10699_25150 [Acaryochloris marina MBIC10699]
MHRVSWLILLQVLVLASPSHVWGMEKQEKREPITHQDSSSKQTDQQKTSAKSGQVKKDKHVPTSSTFEAVFNSIFEMFKQRPEPSLVGRGNLCLISPGVLGQTNVIWSSQPLFLWRGEVSNLLVRDYDTDEVIWQRSDLTGKEQVAFDGKPLQSGQAYIWEASNSETTVRYEFEVMPSAERQLIAAELAKVKKSQNPKLSQKHTDLNSAQYFGEKGLWSDVFQILYSTDGSSINMNQRLDLWSSSVCRTDP